MPDTVPSPGAKAVKKNRETSLPTRAYLLVGETDNKLINESNNKQQREIYTMSMVIRAMEKNKSEKGDRQCCLIKLVREDIT